MIGLVYRVSRVWREDYQERCTLHMIGQIETNGRQVHFLRKELGGILEENPSVSGCKNPDKDFGRSETETDIQAVDVFIHF